MNYNFSPANTNNIYMMRRCLMQAGVRNKLIGQVEEIKADNIMAEIKMSVDG